MAQVNIDMQEVEQIVHRHYNRSHSKNVVPSSIVSFSVAPISTDSAPNGFLAQHQILTVNVTNYCTTNQLTFFVKTLPTHLPKQREYIEGFFAFEKEVCLYQQLIPKALKIETLANHWAANCHLARSNDLIVLDNLMANGFRMATADNGTLDSQHMITALEAIAAMHACSIVMEKQCKRSVFDMYPQCLYENAYPEDDRMRIRKVGFENACRVLTLLIQKIPKYNNRHATILPKFYEQMKRIFQFCKPSAQYRNVFSHGDLWGNNVMFRYAEFSDGCTRNDRIPVEATLVDFQLARYAPPALDVLTLITITSNSEFRTVHLDRLLNAYYAHLCNELQCHDIDVGVELPRNEFMATCRYFELAGLIESCLFSHMTLLPQELSTKMLSSSDDFSDFILTSRVEICRRAFDESEMYRARMTNMLCEIVDKFVL